MSLEDRVAVITGAGGGLGRAVARRLAQAGARLVLVGRDAARLQALGAELELPTGRWIAQSADLAQPQAAGEVLQAVQAAFGGADLLLHFVGGWTGGKLLAQVAPAELELMLQQHVWSTFHLGQVFAPHLLERGWGRIVAVSSPAAGAPPAKSSVYAAAKAAQEALLLSLADEFKGTQITANLLRVSVIDLEGKRLSHPTPANASWSTPDEIAAAILFLCSEEGGRLNGARLPLVGGSAG